MSDTDTQKPSTGTRSDTENTEVDPILSAPPLSEFPRRRPVSTGSYGATDSATTSFTTPAYPDGATEQTSLVTKDVKILQRTDRGDNNHSMEMPSQYDGTPKEEKETCKPLDPIRRTKAIILFVLVATFSICYALFPNQNLSFTQFSVSTVQSESFLINNSLHDPILKLYLRARTISRSPSKLTNNLEMNVTNLATNSSQRHIVAVADENSDVHYPEEETVYIYDFEGEEMGDFNITFQLHSRSFMSVPGTFSAIPMPIKIKNAVIYAGVILIGVYILIIFELVHRTVAAMIGALAGLAMLAVLNEKPDMDTVLSWVDYDTVSLLFGMMVIVAILCETGIFDWLALLCYKIAKGKTWPLITTLCIFSAVVSAFLDNVTTILLLTPVTIRLCEVLDIDPKHVMIAEVVFSNIGGTATGIGDPPNVIILSNPDIISLGIGFGEFTLHMLPGSVIACFAAYGLLRFIYRRKELLRSPDPPEVAEIVREIEIWQRTTKSMVVASREESTVKALLQQKIATLENLVQRKRFEHKKVERGWKIQVEELEKLYYVRDYVLLVKCLIVLSIVILCFFLESFVDGLYLTLGWIPILGAMWLLVLSDFKDLDSILHRIEWATLIFFAALFILMEALTRLGLISFITEQVTNLVLLVPEESRLAVAIIIILWVSALASSFIDNIPYTTAMVPVIVNLSGNPDVNLPMQPLLWALAFGACFGGNGTLIGASANVVSAGIAETHGHGFSFLEFFLVGFPMMLLTTTVAMIYLLICHVAFSWQ